MNIDSDLSTRSYAASTEQRESEIITVSENTFTQDFNEVKADDSAISADQLRDLIELRSGASLDSKTVRAKLRKMQARDQSTLKGARWRIDKALAESIVSEYEKRTAQAAS